MGPKGRRECRQIQPSLEKRRRAIGILVVNAPLVLLVDVAITSEMSLEGRIASGSSAVSGIRGLSLESPPSPRMVMVSDEEASPTFNNLNSNVSVMIKAVYSRPNKLYTNSVLLY